MSPALLPVARGFYYAGAMLLFGGAAFNALLRRHAIKFALPWRWAAVALTLVACVAWLALTAAQMAGDETIGTATMLAAVQGSLFGQVFLARTVALLLLGVAFALDWPDTVAAILAAIALALPALTSHAAASSPQGFAAIGSTLDAVHLLTGGFWIGGLAVLLALLRRGDAQVMAALALFSEWAMIAVLLLVMTGMIDAVSILFAGTGKPSPVYLIVLGIKLVLVLAMLTFAVFNRFRLMPRQAVSPLARNAAVELALGMAVLALAGWLGQLQPTL